MCLYPELSANIQQDCKSASGHKAVFSRSLKAFIWDSSRLEFEAARLVVIVIIYQMDLSLTYHMNDFILCCVVFLINCYHDGSYIKVSYILSSHFLLKKVCHYLPR